MFEDTIIKAILTRVTNAVIDVVIGKKENKSESNISVNEAQIQALVNQKVEEELKNLKENKQEVQLLDAVRSSFVHRIHNLFQQYSIRLEEVPIFLKEFNITHKDVLYEESLLEKFDDNVISFISETLDIQKDWIYGRTTQLLKKKYGYYKRSTFFYKELIQTNLSAIYIFTSRVPQKNIDEENEDNSICIIAEYPKFDLNGRNIKSYTVYDDSCHYGYWRCRYELKRFILGFKKDGILFNLKLYGRVLPNLHSKIGMFVEGKINFRYLLDNSRPWHPEDYVLFPKESACFVENELDELQKIVDEYDNINNY